MELYDVEIGRLASKSQLNSIHKMEGWYRKQKDADPLKTVEKIRKILNDLGIFTYERLWFNPMEGIYSVRVMTSKYGNVGQNGKGMTQELALASAYGEFAERLQNFTLIQKYFGLMTEFKFKHPDTKSIAIDEINKRIINALGGPLEQNPLLKKELNCFPFYDVRNEKVTYIPEDIKVFISSNGFCAGNTPQEAICQGICEILERYSTIAIYNNNLDVPTIPLESIQYLDVYKYILDIKRLGYNVLVKDCTLGGFIPVLAIVIFSRDYSRCAVNFGSDLNFEVALMRCITEAYQGINSFSDQDRFMKLNNFKSEINPLPQRRAKEDLYISKIIDKLLLSEVEPNYEDAFINRFTSNQDSLDFLTKKLIDRGYDIYVRDVSFLGFPSYSVYIPELSECYTHKEVLAYYKLYSKTPPILLQLPKASKEWVSKYITALEAALDTEYFYLAYGNDAHNKFIRDSTKGLILDFRSDLYTLNLQYLLSILYYKLENYDKAMYYLDIYLSNVEEDGKYLANMSYYKCAVYYHKFSSENRPIEVIKKTLNGMFGEALANEIMTDLKEPDNIFQYLKLPTCGNCNNCAVKNECKYDEWKTIILKLQEKVNLNTPDQTELSKYFQNIKREQFTDESELLHIEQSN